MPAQGQTNFYDKCLLTSLVISNILTVFFPPKTFLRFSSALMLRLSFLSCRLFFLMYAQSFFTTSVRGIALVPTTGCSASPMFIGFMNAALGLRFAALGLVAFL